MNHSNFIWQTKLQVGQNYFYEHGGSYGTSENFPIEKLQLKIADKYFLGDGKIKTKKLCQTFV